MLASMSRARVCWMFPCLCEISTALPAPRRCNLRVNISRRSDQDTFVPTSINVLSCAELPDFEVCMCMCAYAHVYAYVYVNVHVYMHVFLCVSI